VFYVYQLIAIRDPAGVNQRNVGILGYQSENAQNRAKKLRNSQDTGSNQPAPTKIAPLF
jgi:hypothetical protein